MDRTIYDRMAESDEQHWWYRARRQILAELIRREVPVNVGGRVLEIGCGTGHNLPMLAEFGSVDAIEVDEQARALATNRLGRPVGASPLPALQGVPDRSYDLIGAFDVIEHIEDDHAALANIAARLRPGGRFVLTVPAHQWMWSAHDVLNHHFRRYSKRSLRTLIEDSPLRLEKIGYFNSILFPLAAASRLAGKLTGKEDSDDKVPPAPVNRLFEAIFASERHLIGRISLPTGVSLFAVCSAT
ncbi:class I SAM-dependent methyltransferase [Sphingomonas ginkgonis]|uniref:Class I SAM-dependent methyltransferase n=1 Tax=Sphingomonas ginkgonis TaxID=2315330 RepID=A0A429V6Z6_9SPHN|nr:class I SAM-dependent methyltransferase [Sphingomonas ginkgonis]RST29682.1 class I SAM-dependent methyltransferase [Sphingomonas ginkgonis]